MSECLSLKSLIKTELPRDFPSTYLLSIDHVAQRGEWDCGIACLHMLCRWQHKKITDDDVTAALEEHSLKEDVWTIDLAYLCSILGIKHRFCTINVEVDPGFKNLPFYATTFFNQHNDEVGRITKLFQRANDEKINVEKMSVSIKDVILHLVNEKQPVIVLVDDTKLCRKRKDEVTDLCEKLDMTVLTESIVPPNAMYWGHFILVIGFDIEAETIFFHDPSKTGANAQSSFENFDVARKSFGTDQDVLFIYHCDEEL